MKKYLGAICLLPLFLASCSKWTDSKALTVQDQNQNPNALNSNPNYQQYLKNLMSYKSSSHSIVMGWVNDWMAAGSSQKGYLNALPDSLDIVCVLNAPSTLSDLQKSDMQTVQTKKGTKVLYGIDAGSLNDSIVNDLKSLTKDSINILVNQYVSNALAQVSSNGYDGIFLNVEGASQDPVYSSPFDSTIVNMITTLGAKVGEKSGTSKLFVLQGFYTTMPSSLGAYLNYFVGSTLLSTWDYLLDDAYQTAATAEGFSNNKYIAITNFSTDPVSLTNASPMWSYGGIAFNAPSGGGALQPSSQAIVAWNPVGVKKGGVGFYYIDNDYWNTPSYQFTKAAINSLNPSQN